MPNPWIASVKQTGQLSYQLDSSVSGSWLTAVRAAVNEFNTLSGRRNLGVRFVQTDQAPTPGGGANVRIATASGSVTFQYEGSHTTNVPGNQLSGQTLLISRVNAPVEKAFVFLPSQPMIYTVSAQRRPTGAGVMKVIALHELIHACGLSNADHTEEDVFNGHPSADPGRTAAQDRVQIQVRGQYRFMPPILFSATTARKISRLWS